MMWSAVSSVAPHSQFGDGARFHLCINKQKRPLPERRGLSLIQDALGKPLSLELILEMKAWIADIFLEQPTPCSILCPLGRANVHLR